MKLLTVLTCFCLNVVKCRLFILGWIKGQSLTLSDLDDVPGLHGQRGEVPAPVDGDALPQDGVQPPDLIPVQQAEPAALLRGVTARHDAPGPWKLLRLHNESSVGGCWRRLKASLPSHKDPKRDSVFGKFCGAADMSWFLVSFCLPSAD